jgi:hypothetical protein
MTILGTETGENGRCIYTGCRMTASSTRARGWHRLQPVRAERKHDASSTRRKRDRNAKNNVKITRNNAAKSSAFDCSDAAYVLNLIELRGDRVRNSEKHLPVPVNSNRLAVWGGHSWLQPPFRQLLDFPHPAPHLHRTRTCRLAHSETLGSFFQTGARSDPGVSPRRIPEHPFRRKSLVPVARRNS